MSKKLIIGADYVSGRGWGTYVVAEHDNETGCIEINGSNSIDASSIEEFKSKLRSLSRSIQEEGHDPVQIVMEDNSRFDTDKTPYFNDEPYCFYCRHERGMEHQAISKSCRP